MTLDSAAPLLCRKHIFCLGNVTVVTSILNPEELRVLPWLNKAGYSEIAASKRACQQLILVTVPQRQVRKQYDAAKKNQ